MTHVRTTPLKASLLVLLIVLVTGMELSLFGGDGPRFSHVRVTPAQLEAISWALDLFEQAELELPDIEFVGHEDREACHGRDGAAREVEGHAVIDLCAAEIGPAQEWAILHEIAHAWDYHNLDDERRAAFLEVRGLSGWREGAWHERGAENAAEIMVWGLIDRPVKPAHIYDNDCDDLLAGYLALVGEAPLHGYTEACEM